MLIEEVRFVFSEWNVEFLSATGIAFIESLDPPVDPNADYRVVYKASFEPIALNKARIEFWLSDSGHVAVGIETYERIARRLRQRVGRHGFVVGHEPSAATVDGLQVWFDAVTHGRIYLEIKSLVGIWNTAKAYLPNSDCDALFQSGYGNLKWIHTIPKGGLQSQRTLFSAVLKYEPW